MRSPGSVLIVVLGLLAILAVVGLTFVTMSNLDRRTAANFALQSQLMLAADAAVDYVGHHLVQDLWYYNAADQVYEERLLTDGKPGVMFAGLIRNEPYDYPSAEFDPWLATSLEGESIPSEGHFSYGDEPVTGLPYGLASWGFPGTPEDERPNNLGFPNTANKIETYTTGRGHGVWISALAFPYDVGLIRVSVTVQDHGALLNLNAHGNDPDDGTQGWRFGYFTSDVRPDHFGDPEDFGFDIGKLLKGFGSTAGLWRQAERPGNEHFMEAVIENPGRYGDNPFTLDEELELRRASGTYYTSRLEQIGRGNTLACDPDSVNTASAKMRLGCTTVSWTSDVRPNYDEEDNRIYSPKPLGRTESINWAPRKIDINLDDTDDIRQALIDGRVFDSDEENALINQFAANIGGFRNGTDGENGIKSYKGVAVGASRQPIFSKLTVKSKTTITVNDKTFTVWKIQCQLISPWPNDCPGGEPGLTLDGISLGAQGGSAFDPELPERMPANSPFTTTLEVQVASGKPPSDKLKQISIRCAGKIIDRIEEEEVEHLEKVGNGICRNIHIEEEHRNKDDTQHPIRVLYVGKWEKAGNPDMDSWTDTGLESTSRIPIRFPRSVRDRTNPPEGGLPPYWMTGVSDEEGFRAFARLGDLNQVLCPPPKDAPVEDDDKNFWPWITRIAKKTGLSDTALLAEEEKVKFNWNDDTDLRMPGAYSRMNAANVLCVGGPWLDRLDNDGDRYCDEDAGIGGDFYGPDEGTGPVARDPAGGSSAQAAFGRFGGPELRVAGKINLNTATRCTLRCLEKSLDLPAGSIVDAVTDERKTEPIRSTAQIVTRLASVTKDCRDAWGQLERRDLVFTRISNIATLRSDTFSVYGTVQYGFAIATAPDAATFEYQVARSRRFWALVDRSPSLAYYPGSYGNNALFIRPRILNFQWLD